MSVRLRPLVAGNWKMNGLRADLDEIRRMRDGVEQGIVGDAEVLVCPPATILAAAAEVARGSMLKIGAQNCHKFEHGAHTGDISPAMLRDAGATYVILGHSERRADHAETNVAVRRKAVSAMGAGLTAIVCVGEAKADRDAGRERTVVGRQLLGSLPPEIDPNALIIAYEPIWAIGTGVTPTADDVADMHLYMRQEMGRMYPGVGEGVRLLYGGSVKPSNAAELLGVANVDGALVGGASLKAEDFLPIAEVYRVHASAAG